MKDPPYKIYVLYAAFLFGLIYLNNMYQLELLQNQFWGKQGRRSIFFFFFAKHCPSFAMLKCISKQNSINNPMWLKCYGHLQTDYDWLD